MSCAPAVRRLAKPLKIGRHRAHFVATFVCDAAIALEVVWDAGPTPTLTPRQQAQFFRQLDAACRFLMLPTARELLS